MADKTSEGRPVDLGAFIQPYRVADPGKFRLKTFRTDDKGGLDKEKAQKILDANRARMNDLQERLYAEGHASQIGRASCRERV